MAIAQIATEYVFSDFSLKDPTEAKYKGVRLELAVDRIVTYLAVGLPLFLISLAFAQEVSVGESFKVFNVQITILIFIGLRSAYYQRGGFKSLPPSVFLTLNKKQATGCRRGWSGRGQHPDVL